MREVERKYVASGGVGVDWDALEGAATPSTFTLRATCVDTPDRRLTDAGWVLRRREGGHDAGWHLKQPIGPDTWNEVHEPGNTRLPAHLRGEVTGAFGKVPLVPVATIVTERTERPLVRQGIVVALLAVDRVEATASGARSSWDEVEVELTEGGSQAVLDDVEAHLAARGYRRSSHGSKTARALGQVPRFTPPSDAAAPARDVLLAYLGKQVGTIQALEAPVLADEPDAVHKSRVATRRLRSLLRTFEPLLDEVWAEDLRDELKWLAEALGGPRDAEVLRDEFGEMLAELGAEATEGPVAERLLGYLATRHERAHAALRDTMAQERYAELLDLLASLLTAAPWLPDADAPASQVLPPLVDVARRRVARLVTKAEKRPEELERWHEVRKAAKAVRYCTEALASAFGQEMRQAADRWTEVTEAFGTLQDAAVAHELLGEVSALAEAAGEPLTTYRVLAEAQDDRADVALAEGKKVVVEALGS